MGCNDDNKLLTIVVVTLTVDLLPLRESINSKPSRWSQVKHPAIRILALVTAVVACAVVMTS